MMLLEVENLDVSIGSVQPLSQISFGVNRGQILVLVAMLRPAHGLDPWQSNHLHVCSKFLAILLKAKWLVEWFEHNEYFL